MSNRELSGTIKGWIQHECCSGNEGESGSWAPVAKELRALAVNIASTKLTRLNVALTKKGKSTNVQDVEPFLSPEFDAQWIINKTIRPIGAVPTTRLSEIRYLCNGSYNDDIILLVYLIALNKP